MICEICNTKINIGDLTLHDISFGTVHASCCGPERESYVNLDTGEPIGPDDPIPTGKPWTEADEPCCDGGPQWGHAWSCPHCPD